MNGYQNPRKLILRNFLSPGDIVMLTAALRDLHKCNPGRFVTDVRTSARDLWTHNPYLTPLKEGDPGVLTIDCQYPLIHRSNQTPFHFIHGFSQFLAERLEVPVSPTAFKGDIHLSDEERGWISQVHEITKSDAPFWIVVAGGKRDFTIKWWSHERFQEVVDHFLGKIQFVQVGEENHHHPPLKNVIDLRGKTSIRQLVRLVHHSQGVLCPVTFLMHLAAAVPVRPGRLADRPCVVVAGGREPSHWEAYPGHRFLHTQGALPCCESGGCWKARTVPLGDGDEKDRRENLCVRVSANGLPRCMDMISSESVISSIQSYFDGGAIRFLGAPRTEGQARKPLERGGDRQASRAGNGKEPRSGTGICLYSLQRSGTHAVANWIVDHFEGRVFYANDCLNCHPGAYENFPSDNLPVFARRELLPVDFRSSSGSDLSIIIFEDAKLWQSWAGEETSLRYKSSLFKVLVLRDPFNMIASRIKLVERVPTEFIQDRMLSMNGSVPAFIPLWKAYAREFIRLRGNPVPDILTVNYNRWTTCKDYRRELSSRLNRPHTDREKESVPGDGFGSSFDGIRYNQNASRMGVLERWKSVESDKRFLEWSSDTELRELSDEIFGKIVD